MAICPRIYTLYSRLLVRQRVTSWGLESVVVPTSVKLPECSYWLQPTKERTLSQRNDRHAQRKSSWMCKCSCVKKPFSNARLPPLCRAKPDTRMTALMLLSRVPGKALDRGKVAPNCPYGRDFGSWNEQFLFGPLHSLWANLNSLVNRV